MIFIVIFFIGGVIGLFIAGYLVATRHRRMKKCPACLSYAPAAAIKCSKCATDLAAVNAGGGVASDEKKKIPRWLKWFYIITFGFLALISPLIAVIIFTAKDPEITSWDQWVKHRDYIKAFSANVMIPKGTTTIYLKANDYYQNGFYRECNLDACGEYKTLIRAARDGAADGILTPQELVEMAEAQVRLNAVIALKDKEFKAKFKK